MLYKCLKCGAVWEEHELNWRKPYTVTPEDSEPHCPDCDYCGFDIDPEFDADTAGDIRAHEVMDEKGGG